MLSLPYLFKPLAAHKGLYAQSSPQQGHIPCYIVKGAAALSTVSWLPTRVPACNNTHVRQHYVCLPQVLSSSTPPPALEAAPSEVVEVDHRCTNRAGGDARLQMLKPLPGPPKGFTGVRAHQLKCTDGKPVRLESYQ